ncbi:MAG: glycosyltransferase family 2 protein [Rudaea sp.]
MRACNDARVRFELLLSDQVVAANAGTIQSTRTIDARTPLLSIIVPLASGDDAELAVLLEQFAALPESTQVIACRTDASRAPAAPALWPKHLSLLDALSPPGRARQMNAGAARANGKWLWFVHADSRLRPATVAALDAFLERDVDALGFFDLAFRDDGPRLVALNAWGANLRSRAFGIPFGDQGLLLRAARFAALGGFDECVAYGEDHQLVWAARHAGVPLQRIAAPLETSARKYAQHGWLRTTLRHLHLTIVQAWPAWRHLRRSAQ